MADCMLFPFNNALFYRIKVKISSESVRIVRFSGVCINLHCMVEFLFQKMYN